MIRENLLDIILENQHLFKHGLCSWAFNLLNGKLITKYEYDYLSGLIKEEMDLQNKFFLEYIWPDGDISYRIEWLKSKLS